jgi:hypothetical protein
MNMTRIQEATKQVVNHISQCSRKGLSERSRKIAEDELAKMWKILQSKKQVKHGRQGH